MIHSLETGAARVISANVVNDGLITNLPDGVAVEVPTVLDALGAHPMKVGDLPPQCAALNRSFLGPVDLAVRAAVDGDPRLVRAAAMVDPNTAATLTVDQIWELCDELTAAHGDLLPEPLRSTAQPTRCRQLRSVHCDSTPALHRTGRRPRLRPRRMRWRRLSSSGPTEIAVWHGYQDTEGDVFKGLVAQYNKDHPDVKVAELYSSNDLVLQKVLTAVRGGSAPDVAYMFGSWSPNIAKIPQVVDMKDEVAKPDWKWDDFYQAERDAATVGDKIVGVPALVDNLAIVYNKKLFADAGVAPPSPNWTWDDFRAAAAKLTDPAKGQYGWLIPADGSEDTVWHYVPMLWEAGGDILSPDNTQGGVQLRGRRQGADRAAADGGHRQVALPRHHQRERPQADEQRQGRDARDGPVGSELAVRHRLRRAGDAHLRRFERRPSDDRRPGQLGGVQQRRQAKKQAAIDFVKWLTAPEQVKAFSLGTGDLPIRTSVGQDQAVLDKLNENVPGTAAFVENLSNVKKVRPQVEQYPAISEALGQAIVSVMLGKEQPAAALNAAAKAADAALAGK